MLSNCSSDKENTQINRGLFFHGREVLRKYKKKRDEERIVILPDTPEKPKKRPREET
jgi:hypothetical protein